MEEVLVAMDSAVDEYGVRAKVDKTALVTEFNKTLFELSMAIDEKNYTFTPGE